MFPKSQSYLYGIEIQHQDYEQPWHQVSIVPLWNWNLRIAIKISINLCLNRTFMELKCWKCMNRKKQDTSQSYLYGIEIYERVYCEVSANVSIVPLWNWNNVEDFLVNLHRSLNRTFMELKWDTNDEHVCKMAVSIVPLWNWNNYLFLHNYKHVGLNRTFMELKFRNAWVISRIGRSQSYLYGIEIAILIIKHPSTLQSQSYLYGIEMKFRRCLYISRLVSIVPLWNWNVCAIAWLVF